MGRGSKALNTLRKNQDGTFGLQITSMIDMFTIILVFLLKSYAASSVEISSSQNITLPSSTAAQSPVEALKLVVSKTGVYVDDKEVAKIESGEIVKSYLDDRDQKFIRPLYDALKGQADKSKAIAKQNADVNFEGKVIFQADKTLNYQLLRKVMYTSSFAGYTDFKFAVISSTQ
jgi:biopolymer transport protein ExbD